MAQTPTLTSCTGSTVDEFGQSAANAFGAGLLGDTRFAVNANWNLSNNKITKPTLSLTITSATAHWTGPGIRDGKPAPQPDAANRIAIVDIEAKNKSHEQKHINGFQSTFDGKKSDIERRLVGQTEVQAATTIQEMNDALKAACEALHKTEGLITWTLQGTAYSIVVKPAGPGNCD
jgi:hypothetical protein